MDVQKDTLIGHIAAEHPAATRVFYRFGIDFCCGGGNSLEAACNARGIDPGAVLDAVREELLDGQTDGTNWNDVDLNVLIDHILVTYHKPLREELPRLDDMMTKVSKVHHEKDARLTAVHSAFTGLRAELDAHMMKEEQILFPMIRQGQGESASGPVSVMEHEHDSAMAALRKMRELTDDFQPPQEACNTWRAMLHGLEALERELHQHIHLENNILFPRALGTGVV
jgi:regulator of cell morphogenesis and NO signaling